MDFTLTRPTTSEFIRVHDETHNGDHLWHYPFPGKTYPLCQKERDTILAVTVSPILPKPFCLRCRNILYGRFTERFQL